MNQTDTQRKPNVFLELIVNVVIPSLILMKLSDASSLGSVNALIFALLFPLTYGLYDLIKYKSFNFISLLGFLSTLLTGGIGLFELDVQWLAVKEAAIPSAIGFVVFLSGFSNKPIIAKMLLNPVIFNLNLIYDSLAKLNNTAQFKSKVNSANHYLSITFVFSAAMNYWLAKWIVTSPTGTVEFNQELGEMTMLSYPIIAIPSFIMLIAILFYVVKTMEKLTSLPLDKLFNNQD
ncbi:VC0807 family protein [uncultured Psychrosphaera sp.]|jgi:hypothetical protein|uniref:VC0807 family protein n=1 Tax=uncultured Psychrosphaera sp. TaxID=1403522 RepID=UPI00262A99CD|nr:VC0807 family protein [uncultured Psychrosphaera sp.]